MFWGKYSLEFIFKPATGEDYVVHALENTRTQRTYIFTHDRGDTGYLFNIDACGAVLYWGHESVKSDRVDL